MADSPIKRPRHGYQKKNTQGSKLKPARFNELLSEACLILDAGDNPDVKQDVNSCYEICHAYYNLYQGKPKKQDIKKTIQDIGSSAANLKERLINIDWFSMTALSDSDFFDHPNMKGAKDYIQNLYQDPELYAQENIPPMLFELLTYIETSCDLIAKSGLDHYGRSHAARPHGPNYKHEIAAVCLRYFEKYHPEKASSYSEGPLYNFIRKIYAMINDTGEEVSFDDAIKKIIRH